MKGNLEARNLHYDKNNLGIQKARTTSNGIETVTYHVRYLGQKLCQTLPHNIREFK